jgi:hypothetical protein
MSQYQQVLEHLEKGYSISQLEATQKYGILRLGAIIFNLRKAGYSISTEMFIRKIRMVIQPIMQFIGWKRKGKGYDKNRKRMRRLWFAMFGSWLSTLRSRNSLLRQM